jgi:putative (di)nucleoside polyphosphate hydrolase
LPGGKAVRVLQVIDPDGFRPNVGIILSNAEGRLLWARRVGQDAWQFPQGGMRSDETPAEAMYRELAEEIGLQPEQVEIIGATRGWLRYRLPRQFIRRTSKPLCIGQKQVWFLLRMLCSDKAVCLNHSEKPEFDLWRWVDYWQPLEEVVAFKRRVYRKALNELAPLLFPDGTPKHLKKDRLSRPAQTQ